MGQAIQQMMPMVKQQVQMAMMQQQMQQQVLQVHQPSPPPPPLTATPPPMTTTSPPKQTLMEKLGELAAAHSANLLNAEEFASAKAEVVKAFSSGGAW
jgi:hypothetical protein